MKTIAAEVMLGIILLMAIPFIIIFGIVFAFWCAVLAPILVISIILWVLFKNRSKIKWPKKPSVPRKPRKPIMIKVSGKEVPLGIWLFSVILSVILFVLLIAALILWLPWYCPIAVIFLLIGWGLGSWK